MKRLSAPSMRWLLPVALAALHLLCGALAAAQAPAYEFKDSHFHLTNNIQEGPDIHDFLTMMSDKAGRVAIGLLRHWSPPIILPQLIPRP